MGTLTVIAITLFTVVICTYVMNVFQVFSESKKLKAEGKTPLVKRNLITVTVAGLAEALVVYLIVLCAAAISVPFNWATVVTIFLAGFLLRNVGAYLSAWGVWSVFVKMDVKKQKKEIEKEVEGAL